MCYLIAAVLLFLAEFALKSGIDARKDEEFPIRLKGGFTLEKHHNHGFMLNKLDQNPFLVKTVSALAMIPLIIACCKAFTKSRSKAEKIGFTLLLSGSVSNVFDRISKNYVVDYLRIPIKKIRHIIFNIADFFLFIGAAVLAGRKLFSK